MHSTDRAIRISFSNQFLLVVLDSPLCEWSKRTIQTLHAQRLELSHVIRQRNQLQEFPKYPLPKVAIQSREYHVLVLLESLFNKWSKSFKKLRLVNCDNLGVVVLVRVYNAHQIICFYTCKGTPVVRL